MVFLAGEIIRFFLKSFCPDRPVLKDIGSHGTFYLDNKFVFSDFSSWSENHNEGLDRVILESRGKRVVFDIGAHIGLVTLPVAKIIAPKGIVFSFEPGSINRSLLERHVEWNGLSNICIVPVAIGDRVDKSVCFSEYQQASGRNALNLDSEASGNPLRSKDHHEGRYNSVSVVMLSIDSFCQDKQVLPDVIKIDVEGAESLVLCGAVKTLKKHKCVVMLSVHPMQLRRFGSDVMRLKDQITDLGYEIKHPHSSKSVVGKLEFKEYLLVPKSFSS